VSFVNRLPLWHFIFQKPGSAISWAVPNECKGRGVTTSTLQGIANVAGTSPQEETQKLINGAFMFDDTSASDSCTRQVSNLLSTGITTQVCARYKDGPGHFEIRFEQCP
jgi:hypothetical protein